MADLCHHNAREQFYLCAYCCKGITGTSTDTTNEHVEARSIAPHRSLEYANIVASCKTKGQCDNSHQNKHLPLTPLMDACESELKFMISGRVEGLTPRAMESIQVLNLGGNESNNKALIEKRKQFAHTLLWKSGINPHEGLEDDDVLRLVMDELLIPKDGKLDPFAPVVANILKNWIKAPKMTK